MDYSKNTIAQLKKICKERKIKGISKKKKNALIDLLTESDNKPDPVLKNDNTPNSVLKNNDKANVKRELQINAEMSPDEYNTTITEIENIAKSINVEKGDCDGRIDSALKQGPFLNKLKSILLERHPDWEIEIPPDRDPKDFKVNGIWINLKLTDCKSSDNSVSKPSIYYSITGLTTYPYSSNWNEFHDRLCDAKTKSQIKKQRYKPTEYHYLVKNKLTGDVILKPIFDIHTYVSNASNDLQINWKKEFAHSEYHIEDVDYLKKVQTLLFCIQKSVKEMIERTKQFAEADINSLLI